MPSIGGGGGHAPYDIVVHGAPTEMEAEQPQQSPTKACQWTYGPQLMPHAPAVLAWDKLTVKTRKLGHPLLNSVSGRITGGFWAVMGPSGSGKTTLLNALACRVDSSMTVAGDMRLNGISYTRSDLKAMSGYVMQDDLLNAYLTVEETLWYAAQLRLPRDRSTQHRRDRVEEALDEMGLTHCRKTIVGDSLHKGISGGERKRLCVAMELLSHPLLLFLDEPTSGLDSVTALSLSQNLKHLGESGRTTVVCTIHQPQYKIFALFDNLILLKSGDIVYLGSTESVLPFFEKAGFRCPEHNNPADFLLDCITPQLGEDRQIAQDKANKLMSHLKPTQIDLKYGDDRPLSLLRDVIPWSKQFRILFHRSMQEQWRRKDIVVTQIVTSIVIAILIGYAFHNLGHDQLSVPKRNAVLFFCVINQGIFASLQTINSFPAERALVLRERAAGTYYVSAYFCAKTAVETVVQMPPPFIFSLIVYHLVGLQASGHKLGIFIAFMVLCQNAAVSIAVMVSTLCRTTDFSVTILPIAFEIGRLFGGFFLPPAQLPVYFSWLDALSYVKYTYTAIALNELDGLKYYCKPKQLVNNVCVTTTGEQVIKRLGLDYLTISQCAGVLIAYIIALRIIAFLGLRYIKW